MASVFTLSGGLWMATSCMQRSPIQGPRATNAGWLCCKFMIGGFLADESGDCLHQIKRRRVSSRCGVFGVVFDPGAEPRSASVSGCEIVQRFAPNPWRLSVWKRRKAGARQRVSFKKKSCERGSFPRAPPESHRSPRLKKQRNRKSSIQRLGEYARKSRQTQGSRCGR